MHYFHELDPREKKDRFSKKYVVAGILVLACAAGVLLFFWKGTSAMGVAKAFVVKSWSDAFGSSFSEENLEEIDLADDFSSSSMDMASTSIGGDVPDDLPVTPALSPTLPNQKNAVSAAAVKQTVAPAPTIPPSEIKNSPQGGVAATLSPAVASAPASATAWCGFPTGSDAAKKIIVNEIAWMGSPAVDAAGTVRANAEWIELKNISGNDIALAGWQLLDASGKIKILFSGGEHIGAGRLLLLARSTSTLGAAKIYVGDLVNTGGQLAVLDPQCSASDFLNALAGWPTGNNTTKQTMERDANGVGWHTSVSAGGTPGKENSIPLTAVIASSSPVPTPAPTPAPAFVPAQPYYSVSVSMTGEGRGRVTSSPLGVDCGNVCAWNFSAGSGITLFAAPDNASLFGGWSGACSGESTACSLTLNGPLSVVAAFKNVTTTAVLPPAASSTVPAATSTTTTSMPPAETSSTPTSDAQPLIVAIQIAGASSTNDFVKLYNPYPVALNVSGWKLRKKTGSGSDSSVREFPDASVIMPGGYFVWANSAGGFSASIGADVSSTATLSVENSVALMDASGTVVDAVAWGTGIDQYVEGTAFSADPSAGQILQRRSVDGMFIDTDDNASDFALQ